MKRGGFTFIELMASMALLAMLLLVGSAIVNSTSDVSRKTAHRTELREEARSIFDRMALDFNNSVRFQVYEMRATDSGADPVLTMLSKSGQESEARLQRIDYYVTPKGLFRSVSDAGWQDSQDLDTVAQGPGELLSPAVGRLAVQFVMSDGTVARTTDIPPTRANPRPAGLMVGLALVNPVLRRNRDLAEPELAVSATATPWVSLDNSAEIQGWRVSDRTFRLP
jgi:prepilin-type N-terminal cleavage/methylation domain-containing protein